MGYTITNIAVNQVKNSILMFPCFYIAKKETTDTYSTLIDMDVNLTGINTLWYMIVKAAGGAGTLQFDIDGATTDKTLVTNSYNEGTMDISGYTGECNLKIKLKNNFAGTVYDTNIQIWGLKT